MSMSNQFSRWQKLVERVLSWKSGLTEQSREDIANFYRAQTAAIRGELENRWFGVWVGFASVNVEDKAEEFKTIVKNNGGTSSPLAGFDPNEVILVRFPTLNGAESSQLWITPESRKYRAAFQAFSVQEYGYSAPYDSGRFLNVDHVFNKARAKKSGLSFVRLALVDAHINQSWGGDYERAATNSTSGNVAGVRFGTDLLLAKLLGLQPPRIDPGTEIADDEIEHFVDELQRVGIQGPASILTANVKLAFKKARDGEKMRRVFAADFRREIFYFILDLPMSADDRGPDWVHFPIDLRSQEYLDEEDIAALKEYVEKELPAYMAMRARVDILLRHDDVVERAEN